MIASQGYREGIEGPTTVAEGGVITVSVHNGATEVSVYVNNDPNGVTYPVVNGRVLIPVPPGVTGGSLITVMTASPIPTAITVEVVSTMH